MNIKLKLTKNTNRSKLIIPVMAVLLLGVMFAPKIANAARVGPPGCSPEEPYNCTMSRKQFDQMVSQWCALADSDKQAGCTLLFFQFVHYKHDQFFDKTGYTIPDYCDLLGNAPAADLPKIPDFCYVIARQNSDFYDTLIKIIDDCGLADAQDQQCVRDLQQTFLSELKPPLAEKPNTSKSGGSGRAIDISTAPASTSFIARVNVYFKWFSIGIGILAVFFLVIAGIQYAAAQDNPQAVSSAKTRINNIVIGIVIYMVMFGLLQWLIPGGAFSF